MNHCLLVNVVIGEALPRNAGVHRIASVLRNLGFEPKWCYHLVGIRE